MVEKLKNLCIDGLLFILGIIFAVIFLFITDIVGLTSCSSTSFMWCWPSYSMLLTLFLLFSLSIMSYSWIVSLIILILEILIVSVILRFITTFLIKVFYKNFDGYIVYKSREWMVALIPIISLIFFMIVNIYDHQSLWSLRGFIYKLNHPCKNTIPKLL